MKKIVAAFRTVREFFRRLWYGHALKNVAVNYRHEIRDVKKRRHESVAGNRKMRERLNKAWLSIRTRSALRWVKASMDFGMTKAEAFQNVANNLGLRHRRRRALWAEVAKL